MYAWCMYPFRAGTTCPTPAVDAYIYIHTIVICIYNNNNNTESCRPCRYYVTNTGRVIGGSEVGVLEIPEETVIQKGRLLPGKMFLIDFAQGKMVSDEEYKAELIAKRSVLSLPPSLSLPFSLLFLARCPVPAAVSVGAGSRSRCMVAISRSVAWLRLVGCRIQYTEEGGVCERGFSIRKRALCVTLA